MAHPKVLSPATSSLSDLLGPLPTEEDEIETRFEDPTESVTQVLLKTRVEEEVKLTTNDAICLPPSLLDDVTANVLLLAKDEPCGLRGCVLLVLWNDGENDTQDLAKVKADATMPTTHFLVLTLRPDCAAWYTKMARIIRSLDKKDRKQILVSPQYELVKKRLCDFEE